VSRPRISLLVVFLVILLSSSCRQSPLVTYRRSVDQAASWAAAIQYAHELESRRAVPNAYLKKAVEDGRTEIETVRKTITESNTLPAALKDEATTLCDQMIGVLTAGAREPQDVDVTRLAQIEHAFRALVSKAGGQ
jgi:hypothetical protein